MSKKINSRQKGAAGEREAAKFLREEGYTESRRGQQFSGSNGDADVVGVDGLHLEIKRVEKLNIDDALNQSINDAIDGEIPVVMHRKNRTSWKITILAKDFFKIWKGKDK